MKRNRSCLTLALGIALGTAIGAATGEMGLGWASGWALAQAGCRCWGDSIRSALRKPPQR